MQIGVEASKSSDRAFGAGLILVGGFAKSQSVAAKDYTAFMNAVNYYKWSAHDALSMFCEYADILISTMDTDDRFRSDDGILDELE